MTGRRPDVADRARRGGLRILPVHGIPEVTPGDDLAALIGAAAPWLRDGDVLVVTSKIVSKSEGRLVDVPAQDGPARAAARAEVLAAETARVVARRGPTTIVQTHHGFVMAAAGIDASNVERDRLVLLPKDPDAAARELRTGLRHRHGVDVAVIISDTMGRPWRNGLTDVALGAAGLPPVRDHRGEVDPYGNELQVTEMAVIDELAGAGELVKGKCDQVPVAVVRGYLRPDGDRPYDDRPDDDRPDEDDQGPADGAPAPDDDRTADGAPAPDGPGAAALVRDGTTDMFSLGTDEARALGRRDAAVLSDPATLPGGAVDPAALARAVATAATAVAEGTGFTVRTGADAGAVVPGATAVVHCRSPADPGPAGWLRFGADLHRLRAALAAEGLFSTVSPTTDPPATSAAKATSVVGSDRAMVVVVVAVSAG
ncbi:MAG TPA: coenzyme F420-0:L-glutamate ligase [Catenuloplanes sp.]|jgi:coenzyme F420-0:L-glutamate ligase/coenzyme F420-1:gamma-L-glutamate ligase